MLCARINLRWLWLLEIPRMRLDGKWRAIQRVRYSIRSSSF